MANAFQLAACPKSMLLDVIGITKLKTVNPWEHDLVLHNLQGGSIKELETICRKWLPKNLVWLTCDRREIFSPSSSKTDEKRKTKSALLGATKLMQKSIETFSTRFSGKPSNGEQLEGMWLSLGVTFVVINGAFSPWRGRASHKILKSFWVETYVCVT